MMITANFLVTDFGFKRRTKNKEKFLVNSEYDITLKAIDSSTFIDINTNDEYHSICDVITRFAMIEIEKNSKLFHSGLDEKHLRQGNFSEVYKENKQKGDFFISHEKAKTLLEAQFNRQICNALMHNSSSGDNFDYYIRETKYEFRQEHDSDIVTLKLYYNYKDRKGHHDFWVTHDIYNFNSDKFHINHRVSSSVPIDLIIEKFLK